MEVNTIVVLPGVIAWLVYTGNRCLLHANSAIHLQLFIIPYLEKIYKLKYKFPVEDTENLCT